MKIFWIVLAVVVVGLLVNAGVTYLLQRRRQQQAERDGVVVYATVVSLEAVGGLMKYAEMKKVTLRIQEPGATAPREVSMRTRVPPGQKISAGMRIPVAVDAKSPKRIYPVGAEAAKRAVITGSRLERRHMRVGGARQAQQQPQRDSIPFPRNQNRR